MCRSGFDKTFDYDYDDDNDRDAQVFLNRLASLVSERFLNPPERHYVD